MKEYFLSVGPENMGTLTEPRLTLRIGKEFKGTLGEEQLQMVGVDVRDGKAQPRNLDEKVEYSDEALSELFRCFGADWKAGTQKPSTPREALRLIVEQLYQRDVQEPDF
ncbi:MAG: hypothetical protein WC759_03980 [Candidatus Micrarchaeia archaeon]|jgi:hypothetical protein